jgi:hypothetical protein
MPRTGPCSSPTEIGVGVPNTRKIIEAKPPLRYFYEDERAVNSPFKYENYHEWYLKF